MANVPQIFPNIKFPVHFWEVPQFLAFNGFSVTKFLFHETKYKKLKKKTNKQ